MRDRVLRNYRFCARIHVYDYHGSAAGATTTTATVAVAIAGLQTCRSDDFTFLIGTSTIIFIDVVLNQTPRFQLLAKLFPYLLDCAVERL